MDDFDRSDLIIKCETREELMEKLKEKNETFEETFNKVFELSYYRRKNVQNDIIEKFLDLKKDIPIINTLNDNQLKYFMKAFSESVDYSSGRFSKEEVILNWVKLICQIDMNTFNRLFQSNDIINAYESIPNVLLVLEELIPIMPEERFKILCPLYRRTESGVQYDYSCSWLDIMKEKFPEKHKLYSNFLVDECIESIKSEIDYNIFKESWIDLVLERLIKEENMDGLIKLLHYKVNHYKVNPLGGDDKSDIPLKYEQIKLILDTLTDKKIDLFSELTRLIYHWSPIEESMIDPYSKFIVKFDGNLLDSYTALLDNAIFSENGFKKFIKDLRFYYNDKMYYLRRQKETGFKYLAEGLSQEKLDKIRQFVTKLEKRYIKLFSESIEIQDKYFEERSSLVHDWWLLDIDDSICDLVKQGVSNEEIDELVALTPIPVLLKSFRWFKSFVLTTGGGGVIYTDTFCYFEKKIWDKVIASNNVEYIFEYLNNDDNYHIIPWKYLLENIENMDSNLIEEIYKRMDLIYNFIKISKTSIHENKHKGNEEQAKEHEKFRNKLISNLLKEQSKKEDVEDIKLFNLAISLGSLKYMYIYYCKITGLNKEIDKDTMDKFINRVINTRNIQYIFLVFTQVLKNDLINFYEYSYKLLKVIFISKDSYLLSIILNNYKDILSPALSTMLTNRLTTVYNIGQHDCQIYLGELQCDLLNNDDTNANHHFKENSRNWMLPQSPHKR